MNTTIKMCEKAEEIQKGHKWQEGDYYYTPIVNGYGGRTYIACNGCNSEFGSFPDNNSIWLPRQGQLQKMVEDLFFDYVGDDDHKEPDPIGMLYSFYKFSEAQPRLMFSMGQNWLAFVMKEKYNKVWDGGDWVKEK